MNDHAKFYVTTNGDKIWYLPSEGKEYWHCLNCQHCSCSYAGGCCVCVEHTHSNEPAYEGANGTKLWYVNGNLHREDSPAVEWKDGSKEWWVNSKRHRIDGPAVEEINGRKEWWINDKYLPTEKVETWIKENKIDLNTIEGRMAFKLRWP